MKIKFVDKLLNFVFKNKPISLVLPLILGIFAYVPTLLSYADDFENRSLILKDLIIAICWYFGVFLILSMLARIKNCPDWYIDNFELLLLVATAFSAIYQLANYIFGSISDLSSACFVCIITWSAVSLAHNKRGVKNDT